MTEATFLLIVLKYWEEAEARRIEILSSEALLEEIASIMSGHCYSWLTIKKRLRAVGISSFTLHRRWNTLCNRRLEWNVMSKAIGLKSQDRSSTFLAHLEQRGLWNAESYQRLLLNLKMIPIHAGLGLEGKNGFLDSLNPGSNAVVGLELVNVNIDNAGECED